MTEYSNALEYLYSLEKFGMVFGLENVQWILNIIGNPHKFLKTVHIGGTNGKGSVAAMLSHILKAAGYRVGKYTSPHLVSFTERITINEVRITEAEVADLVASIRQRAESVDPKRIFTFFDFTTALAFEYFRRSNVDIALIEVGLGGRLDSTNVVNPLVSVITNVAFDHMDCLGEDILHIAREKAGIIKKDVPLVTGALDLPGRIIEETGNINNSPVYVMRRDFLFEKKATQTMLYAGLLTSLDNVYVNLKGDHQLGNAAIALCTAELLSTLGFGIDQRGVYAGLSEVTWLGRLEIIKENPTIILDGAHNVDGIRTLVSFLKSEFPDRRRLLIFGVMKDKEYEKMLSELLPFADEVIFTSSANDRALFPESMKKFAPKAFVADNASLALKKAKSMLKEKDVIIITGSLYLIGECTAIIDDIF
jgi:dihydrofolate synthase / folylpolyglutamate synthase